MLEMPQDWWALTALVFVLGVKHGLDADHLVAIDGLTRFNLRSRPGLARWCGALFSLGHGVVVVAVAFAVGFATQRWIVPGWLEDLGAWTSIVFLTLLGTLNLLVVVRTPGSDLVTPVAVKGRLLDRFTRTTRPAVILLVGALFALSFDTISQAALFSLTASQFGGWQHGVALGLLFTLAMTSVDGANGLWISTLLRRADRRARIASRVMGLVVATLSLGVAVFGAAKYVSASVAAWSEGRELAIGVAVVTVVAVAFFVALLLARMSPPAPAAEER